MQHPKHIKHLLIIACILIGTTIATHSHAQCSYRSRILGFTTNIPMGWQITINDKPRNCDNIDSFNASEDIMFTPNAQAEQIQLNDGDRTTMLLLAGRTKHIDESMEKDFHKMCRYKYRVAVFPFMRQMNCKPKNEKIVKKVIAGRTYSITKTNAMIGQNTLFSTYLYTWTEGNLYFLAILFADTDRQNNKLLEILTETINSY